MTIYLVRHGRAAAGVDHLDPGLDEIGWRQARAVAEDLRTKRIGRLVVSPMRRCLETVGPLAEALAAEPEVRDEVSEVFDPSMPAEDRRLMLGPFMQSRWRAQPEELQAWRRRCVDAVLELSSHSSGPATDLVIVSHYIAICAVLGEALNDDRVVPVPLANASITSFEAAGSRLELVAAGDTSHLPPELVTGVNTATLGERR